GAPEIPGSTKNPTNLLPPETVAVYRFNMDRVQESPLYGQLADRQISEMFHKSMGFPLDDSQGKPNVEVYIHCLVGPNRDSFGVMRLKNPTKPTDITRKMQLQPKPETVKGRTLHITRSPFVLAVANTLTMQSLVGDLYEKPPTVTPPAEKPIGVCVYDTQHILIGDHSLLKSFLGTLDENGYPPFKSVMMSTPAPPAPPPKEKDATDTTDVKPAPPPPPQPKTQTGDQVFTSIDAYRTLKDPALKKALDDLEANRATIPLFVYAEKFDLKRYNPALLKSDYKVLSETLTPIAESTKYLSASVLSFTRHQLFATVRITTGSTEKARALAKDHLGPGLTTVADLLKLLLATPVLFRDYTLPDGPKYPMDPMYPTYPGFDDPTYPDPDDPDRRPGGLPGPKGPPGYQGSGGGPPKIPIMPPGPGDMITDPPKKEDTTLPTGYIDLVLVDDQLRIMIALPWPDSAYRVAIAPRLMGLTNQMKGKMAIFSSETSWIALAAAGPAASKKLGMYPRGTVERPRNSLDLEPTPEKRVSLFADLLPYMGRGRLYSQINRRVAWNHKDNLSAASEWVPELLVPYYPQSAWRATWPDSPDHVFGATNYVAIAGEGLGAARYDPTNKTFAKKLGMTGYGWGSKADEVTDGLANTIYIMQTPPGLQQPWMAGGGATVRGLDERDPMAGFRYTHPGVGGRTKQGTYALMGDGSVRFIPADIDPKLLLAMSTRSGGELLADVDTYAPLATPPKPKPKPVTPPDDKKTPEAPPVGVQIAPPPRPK
ncbi:MAG: DUF1559 domain-containing protein, partial [Planctomycetia bacterium]|nr:DUF1559 domain-containing protein [Planctomycetia bacterium]